MTRLFSVTLPISGVIYVDVQADDAEAAIDKAMEMDFSTTDIEMWEFHRDLVQGNVCYASVAHATAEDTGEAEDDSPA